MITTDTRAAISVISQDIEVVTIPFQFELQVTGGLEERGERDPAQLALLAGAWSEWWSQFSLDLASPEQDAFPGRDRSRVIGKPAPAIPREGAALEAKLWDLGLAHPSEIAGPGGGMEHHLAPRSKEPNISGEFSLEEPPLIQKIRRDRRPGPDEGFAFTLAYTSDALVRCGPQLFCIGIPWVQWQRPLPNGVHPFDLVVFEVGFDEFDAWIGSENTKGSGWVRIVVGSLLVPLLLYVAKPFAAGKMEQIVEQHNVATRLLSVHGTPCDVKGYISLDLSNLSSVVEAKLRGSTREDICMFQTALYGVGENPGTIDGIYGRNTKAAEEAFRNKWGLQGIAKDAPQFSSTLINALRGHTPNHK